MKVMLNHQSIFRRAAARPKACAVRWLLKPTAVLAKASARRDGWDAGPQSDKVGCADQYVLA